MVKRPGWLVIAQINLVLLLLSGAHTCSAFTWIPMTSDTFYDKDSLRVSGDRRIYTEKRIFTRGVEGLLSWELDCYRRRWRLLGFETNQNSNLGFDWYWDPAPEWKQQAPTDDKGSSIAIAFKVLCKTQ
jgi:hypothetical protein